MLPTLNVDAPQSKYRMFSLHSSHSESENGRIVEIHRFNSPGRRETQKCFPPPKRIMQNVRVYTTPIAHIRQIEKKCCYACFP
jgi:hypothetical protein